MNNRVYYGEYTLKHWIDLMMKQNIILPPYQRSFVWSKESVLHFIQSLKEKQFIPPVTIAHYNANNGETNYILDGQQRLTSILLAYIGSFPIKDKFKASERLSQEENGLLNDDMGDDIEDDHNKSIEWTFANLYVPPKPKELLRTTFTSVSTVLAAIFSFAECSSGFSKLILGATKLFCIIIAE